MLLLVKKYYFIFQLTIVSILAGFQVSYAIIPSENPSLSSSAPNCEIHFQARHALVFCSDEWEADEIEKPAVYSECGEAWLAGYEEKYYPFTSNKGFTDYFELSNWRVTEEYGDGGVDVTGAPIELQVEGAGNLLVRKSPKSTIRLEIIIPANGYLSFNLSKIGGSIFISSTINGEKKEIAADTIKNATFLSPFLYIGDVFIFEIQNKGKYTEDVLFEAFEFLTNAIGLTERHWTAFNHEGNYAKFVQFVTIQRTNLIDIVFPDNIKNVSDNSPKHTGFPMLDTDGLFFTTTDRIPIEQGDCLFTVEWKDELKKEGEKEILLRHWIVRDLKTQSIIKDTQKISFLDTSSTPSSLSKKRKEQDNTMNSVKSKKRVGF